jgi:hypothetical protein
MRGGLIPPPETQQSCNLVTGRVATILVRKKPFPTRWDLAGWRCIWEPCRMLGVVCVGDIPSRICLLYGLSLYGLLLLYVLTCPNLLLILRRLQPRRQLDKTR